MVLGEEAVAGGKTMPPDVSRGTMLRDRRSPFLGKRGLGHAEMRSEGWDSTPVLPGEDRSE